MFLTIINLLQGLISFVSGTIKNLLKEIADLIEKYPTTVKTALQVIPAIIIITGIGLWTAIWIRKNRERINASISFYPIFKEKLKNLKDILINQGLLETDDKERGNIFALLYPERFRRVFCPSYHETPLLNGQRELELAVSRVEEETNNPLSRLHPRHSNEDEWIQQTEVVFSFCRFILNEEERSVSNKEILDGHDCPQHIERARSLIQAIDYSINAIDSNYKLFIPKRKKRE